MPPLALATLLHQALPWLSVDGRAVVNTLVCDNGRVGSAQALCQRVGLRSRFQLNRLLRREGLPPYEELAGWVCVFYWMVRGDAADGRVALRSLAPQTRIEIASRSEEHTSELQSLAYLVCRLLLEKKKKKIQ